VIVLIDRGGVFDMNKYFILVACLFSFAVNASQKAITDEGEVVLLSPNGTWSYESDGSEKPEISMSKTAFKKPEQASFTLKSKVNKSAFALDPKAWSFKKGEYPGHEYGFTLNGSDVYAMAITEGLEIGLSYLGEIALMNAQAEYSDMKIVQQEYRNVNGAEVLYMEMAGTAMGMSLVMFGYYYSNESGSTQLVAYTGSKVAPKYKSEIAAFLNGLVLQ
jgi:hypothetical protein